MNEMDIKTIMNLARIISLKYTSYFPNFLEAEDLQQEGIIEALKHYKDYNANHSSKASLSTFISSNIKWGIKNCLKKESKRGIGGLPKKNKAFLIPLSSSQYSEEGGMEVSQKEAERKTSFSFEKLYSNMSFFEKSIKKLSEKKKKIVILWYIYGYNGTEIGKILGCSREYVRQVKEETKSILRETLQ